MDEMDRQQSIDNISMEKQDKHYRQTAIPVINSWPSNKEHKLSEFGLPYIGYYIDGDRIRYVGYVRIKQQYIGKGFFKMLMDTLKKDMKAVVLESPTELTIKVAAEYGYTYDEINHRMIWKEI